MVGSTSSGVLGALQTLVLMPLYLSEIGPALYGAWCGSGDLLVWLQTFDFGLPNIMIQRIGAAHGRGDQASIGAYLCSGMAMVGLVAVAALAAAFAVRGWVPLWMGLHGPSAQTLSTCFLIGAAAAVMNILSHGIHGLAKGIQQTAFVNAALVAATAAGFGVTAALLLGGWGLYSIAWGSAVRAGIALAANLWFAASVMSRGLWRHFQLRGPLIREMAVLSPPVLLAGVSYGVMNNSQAAIAAMTLGPSAATVLTVTRRAMDLARYFSDVVAYAAYGGFASLFAGEEGRGRAMRVRAEVVAVYMTIAVALGMACMSVNPSFVTVWVGAEQFGGPVLTVVLATGLVVSGWSFLSNYLYRATGKQAEGAWMLVGEAVVRVPLMAALAQAFGLTGLAAASIGTAAISGWLAYRGTLAACYAPAGMKGGGEAPPGVSARLHAHAQRIPSAPRQSGNAPERGQMLSIYALLWVLGAAVCVLVVVPSWLFVAALGLGTAGASLLLLRQTDPLLHHVPLFGKSAPSDEVRP